MSISRDEVHDIAHLARLHVEPSEVEAYAGALSRILELVEQMNAIDTTGVEPMSHPFDATLRLRADAVTEVDRRDEFQPLAPSSRDGLYLVPRVIE